MSLIILIIHFFLWQFVFSFQRITLKTARKVSDSLGFGVQQYQMALTPQWIGTLGWINKALSLLLFFLIFLEYGLMWSIIVAFCVYSGLYALFTGPFEKAISEKSKEWMLEAIKGIKNTGYGYLMSWKLEEVITGKQKKGNYDRPAK